MTLVLDEAGAPPESLDGWPVLGRPKFVSSQAYVRLQRALRRYVDEEIPGRSFLISGHRGTGKTALVTMAVEDLRTERLRASVKVGGAVGSGVRSTLQRPLFVKLHGPSLLTAVLHPAESPEASGDGDGSRPEETVDGKASPAKSENRKEPPTKAEDGDATPDIVASQSHVALVQITLALYRALAAEVAVGFAAHARFLDAQSPARNDFLEMAAQLALELDGAPGPAVLRRYWSLLGRLPGQGLDGGLGVLWPRTADPTLADFKLNDQGLREIVAVATAAQTYRITAGKESQTETDSNSAKREVTLSASAANVSDLFNRAAAVLAGGAAGAATLDDDNSLAAVVTGLVTALLTGTVLNWTSIRSQKREQILNYTFIKNRTEATLERDLPTVIRRIRDAGLAPVFILDELDKLDEPRTRIRLIINRLKHLVTDHGFFCFLTDRNYFDQTQQAVEREVYPTEHTYFSERLLVLYSSQELLQYLHESIRIASPYEENEEFARLLLALSIIQRAKLNFADISRELSRLGGQDGVLRVSSKQILDEPRYRLAAVMQLAVDEMLRSAALSARVDSDPGFAQLAVDALYMVSRRWEEDKADVDLSTSELKSYLERRLVGASAGREKGAAPADDKPVEPSAKELELLREQLTGLCRLLSDWKLLSAAVDKRTDLPGFRPGEVVPVGLPRGLVEPAGGDKWRFLYDMNGVATGAATKATGTGVEMELTELVALVDGFADLMRETGFTLEDLTVVAVLPRSLSWSLIWDAANRNRSRQRQQADSDLARLREFSAALKRNRIQLSCTFLVVDGLRHRAGLPISAAPEVLRRLTRYLSFAVKSASRNAADSAPFSAADFAPRQRLAPTAPGLVRFKELLLERRDQPSQPTGIDERQLWDVWARRITAIIEGQPGFGPIFTEELLAAAADVPPSAWFKLGLDRMTIGDWSRLVLATMSSDGAAPAWAALAGLRFLGFDGKTIERVFIYTSDSRRLLQPSEEDARAAARLIETAPQANPGILFIAARGGAVLDERPLSFPVFGVEATVASTYRRQIDALSSLGAFRVIMDELV